MRHTQRVNSWLFLFLALCGAFLVDVFEAQAFTVSSPSTVNNEPVQPGNLVIPPNNGTTYFQNRLFVTPGNLSSGLDAIVWVRTYPGTVLPPGWVGPALYGGVMYQCIPSNGDVGGFSITSFGVSITWGTTGCSPQVFDPLYNLWGHYAGQPNGPIFPDLPPDEASTPCPDNKCADPVSMVTGLYYQEDTDLEVPDVMPIQLTRTYRTKDTGKRVFGIGASHPYEQSMLRDDLCTEVRIILPDGGYRAFLRTSGTNCLDSTLQHTTTFGYDTKGNLTTITNAVNKTTTITVNNQGQPLTIKDPLNNITTFTYELGDLISVKDPVNRETKRMLDAAGRLRSLINPLGQKTIYTPDALDRITQLTDALNGVTQFGYDPNSNLLTVTDAKSQQTVYTYSNMNRTSTRKDPLLNTETYTYDNNGNFATVLDRKSQTTTYTYDPLNRRTKTTFQDGTSTNYTYDAGNRITQVQEKNAGGTVTATITRTYDGLDRLTQEVTAEGTVNYTYDNASRRTSMTVAGQTAVTYTYDNANRLTQVQQGTSTITIGYDDADR